MLPQVYVGYWPAAERYNEKLWPRSWKWCPKPQAEGSIFKPENRFISNYFAFSSPVEFSKNCTSFKVCNYTTATSSVSRRESLQVRVFHRVIMGYYYCATMWFWNSCRYQNYLSWFGFFACWHLTILGLGYPCYLWSSRSDTIVKALSRSSVRFFSQPLNSCRSFSWAVSKDC